MIYGGHVVLHIGFRDCSITENEIDKEREHEMEAGILITGI